MVEAKQSRKFTLLYVINSPSLNPENPASDRKVKMEV
jgi:hypothetical protein